MLKQIAALKTYKELCSDGYRIAETGILAVRTIKGTEFNLHNLYFSSLKKVSVQVAGYLNQTGAVTTANKMVADLRWFSAVVESSSVWQGGEKRHVETTLSFFTRQVQQDEDMIATMLADGQTSMSDGERICLLMSMVQIIQEQHRSVEDYIDRASLLMRRRGGEGNDNWTILSFY